MTIAGRPITRISGALIRAALIRAALLQAAAAMPWLTSGAMAASEPRMIWVLVVKPPADAESGVASWVGLFKHNIPVLLSEVTDGSGSTHAFAPKIDDRAVSEAKPSELKAYYESQPSLGAFSTTASSDGSVTYLDNILYLGQLKGQLATPFVHFTDSVLPSQYETSRDATSVVTLYGFAMLLAQSGADRDDPDAVCRTLGRAHSYVDGLGIEVRNDLREVVAAISQELQTHRCGPA